MRDTKCVSKEGRVLTLVRRERNRLVLRRNSAAKIGDAAKPPHHSLASFNLSPFWPTAMLRFPDLAETAVDNRRDRNEFSPRIDDETANRPQNLHTAPKPIWPACVRTGCTQHAARACTPVTSDPIEKTCRLRTLCGESIKRPAMEDYASAAAPRRIWNGSFVRAQTDFPKHQAFHPARQLTISK
jgi:hypothetical protein